jgi:hypothetical protein
MNCDSQCTEGIQNLHVPRKKSLVGFNQFLNFRHHFGLDAELQLCRGKKFLIPKVFLFHPSLKKKTQVKMLKLFRKYKQHMVLLLLYFS